MKRYMQYWHGWLITKEVEGNKVKYFIEKGYYGTNQSITQLIEKWWGK